MSATRSEDDKFTLDYARRGHSGGAHHKQGGSVEISREDMVLKNYQGELEMGLKNLVGPAFFICGMYGFFAGIVQSARTLTFKNRPKKLIMTSVINTVGKQSSFYANNGASLGLMYCLTKKTLNFLFDEDLQDMSDTGKQAVYGFVTGAIFKSTRGLLPALLSATLLSGFCSGVSYVSKKYNLI